VLPPILSGSSLASPLRGWSPVRWKTGASRQTVRGEQIDVQPLANCEQAIQNS